MVNRAAVLTAAVLATTTCWCAAVAGDAALAAPAAVPSTSAPGATVPDLPSAPLEPRSAAGNRSATVTWRLPAGDGGVAITAYLVDVSADGGLSWPRSPLRVAGGSRSAVVTGLENGATYVLRVAAVNAAGPGPWSAPTAPVVPAVTAPSAPTAVAGTPSAGKALVTWSPPADDGGSPITSYVVDRSQDGGATWLPAAQYLSVPPPASDGGTAGEPARALVPGLADGVSYRFRVAAVSSLGRGTWSLPSAAVAPSASIAVLAPKGFRVARTAGNPLDLTVRWRPVPGAERYAVTVTDTTGSWTRVVDVTTTSVQVPSAGPCSGYRVAVSAVDAAGAEAVTGPWRVASAAPGGVGALASARSADGRSAKVTWREPRNPGHGGVTGYHVVVTRPADGRTLLDHVQSSRTVTLTRLDPARTYRVGVTAVNAYGSCVTGTSIVPKPAR